MSVAAIDRYPASENKRLGLKGTNTTRNGALLLKSITVRKVCEQAVRARFP